MFIKRSYSRELCVRDHHLKGKLVSVQAEVAVGFEMQALIDGSARTRKKVTATLLGIYETGQCFGHQCFSRAQLRVRQVMNVTAVERRLAPDFSAYDCSLLTRDVRVNFQKGHMDNVPDGPLFMRSLQVVLTGPNNDAVVAEAHPIFQIALGARSVEGSGTKRRVFRLSSLAPGYVFSASANGFQSVTGCFVIKPNTSRREPIRIDLPLGVWPSRQYDSAAPDGTSSVSS